MTQDEYRKFLNAYYDAEDAYAKAIQGDDPEAKKTALENFRNARTAKRNACDEYRRDTIASESVERRKKMLEYWEDGYLHAVQVFGGNPVKDSLAEATWLWVKDYRASLGMDMPPLSYYQSKIQGIKVDIGNDEFMIVMDDGTIYNSHGNVAKPSYSNTTRFTYLENAYNWRVKSYGGHATVSVAKLLCKAYFPEDRDPVRIEIIGDQKAYPTKETIRPIYEGEPYHTVEEVEQQNAFYRELGKRRSGFSNK